MKQLGWDSLRRAETPSTVSEARTKLTGTWGYVRDKVELGAAFSPIPLFLHPASSEITPNLTIWLLSQPAKSWASCVAWAFPEGTLVQTQHSHGARWANPPEMGVQLDRFLESAVVFEQVADNASDAAGWVQRFLSHVDPRGRGTGGPRQLAMSHVTYSWQRRPHHGIRSRCQPGAMTNASILCLK